MPVTPRLEAVGIGIGFTFDAGAVGDIPVGETVDTPSPILQDVRQLVRPQFRILPCVGVPVEQHHIDQMANDGMVSERPNVVAELGPEQQPGNRRSLW